MSGETNRQHPLHRDDDALDQELREALPAESPRFCRPSHPTIEAYVRGEANADQRDEILRALSLSMSFRKEILERTTKPSPSNAGGGGWLNWLYHRPPAFAAVAAMLLLVILAYPGYLGVRRSWALANDLSAARRQLDRSREEIQAVRDELSALQSDLASLGGHVDVYSLRPPERSGGAAAPSLELRVPDRPYITLAVLPDGYEEFLDSATWSFGLYHDGIQVWSVETTQLRKVIGSGTGMYYFSVPRTLLPPGSYQLRVSVDANFIDSETVDFTVVEP
ncbi:MAG TPA: hypothetical protein VEK15_06430 [Vicinamibacteria bacterium]|nr:hypothetical protein [Vicinamibacteria bacterium]